MKNLSKAQVGALCATLLFAAPLPAFAQGMPVHDSASLVQQINAVRQALQVVAQGKQQIAEAQKLYQDLNKLTDIPASGTAAQIRCAARTRHLGRLARRLWQRQSRCCRRGPRQG